MGELNDREERLIELLREEAWKLKDCFTQYSFQCMALCSAILLFLFKFQIDQPFIGLACILPVILVLAVTRIGIHKYSGANRNHGYQLYLERIIRLKSESHQKRNDILRNIGWEEAMRAWRIVQTTTYKNIYTTGFWKVVVPNEKRPGSNYNWFEPKKLLATGASWHAGSYLGNMFFVLHIVAFLSLTPLVIAIVQMYFGGKYAYAILFFLTLVIFLYIIMLRVRMTKARKIMLEEGFLSIHSCAIMWHAVSVSFSRAMVALGCDKDGEIDTHKKLTYYISLCAIDLNKDVGNIYRWIEEDDNNYVNKHLINK